MYSKSKIRDNPIFLFLFVVKETEDLYLGVTLPCIQQEQFSLDWVYNILGKNFVIGVVDVVLTIVFSCIGMIFKYRM